MKYLFIIISLLCISKNLYAIELKECRIGTENSIVKVKAQCGHFSVPENRNNPSKMIDLKIAIVRTKSAKKLNDPVIMLAGGPGQSAVDTFPQTQAAFKGILKNRDIILVDQRGTGGSNKLECNFNSEIQEQMLIDKTIRQREIKNCVARLDADTRYYTTMESIKDLEEVRKALAIDKWNLIGISYGTRKALTYIKMFPNSIRSVVLDSVVHQQEPLAQSHEKNLISALRKQFKQCEKQPACYEAFGDVEQQMWEMLDRVDKENPKIKLLNATSGQYEDITITKEYLISAIRIFAYSPRSFRMLPLLIAQANHGHLEALASQANLVANMMEDALSNVELSIICAEDLPFYEEYKVNENNLFGSDLVEQLQKTCAVWPHIKVDASFKDSVVSDLPVLLLSGELDPVTPPEFAEIAKKTLSNSQHLIMKGQGHSSFLLGCVPDIITDFFNEPESELNIECLKYFDYTPYFINMMGPKQ